MSRWVIGALGASSGLLLMVLAMLLLSLFGRHVPTGGVLAALLPVLIGSAMLAAIVVPVWVIGRLRHWSDQQQSRQRMRGLDRELALLAADPERSRWLPLASKQFTADAATVTRWESRYQQLLADPIRYAHAAACLHGSFPSNADIDYSENPLLTRTCGHLHSVERGLRQQGYRCGVLDKPGSIWALARVANIADLRRQFALDSVVGFASNVHEKFSDNDRGPYEVEEQSLYCKRCDSVIRFELGPLFPPD